MIYLGNLTLPEIERRSGVTFPVPLREYMGGRHQASASNVQPGKWHCFDIPFTLVCGDMETAKTIHSHLAPLAGEFKEPLQISLNQ